MVDQFQEVKYIKAMKRLHLKSEVFWNFIAKNKLQINSRDKSRDPSHTIF